MTNQAEDLILKCRNDKVLTRFRAAVAEIYRDRLERVVLFGSRARGDARPDSDYDIAVFLKDAGAFAAESARLATISTDILLDTGAVISATPFPAAAYRDCRASCMSYARTAFDL
jgi:predicted nucleotidyltransferase